MKKKYNISLDVEAVETLKPWLKDKGIAFSTYVNAQLKETVEAIKVIGKTESMKDVTLSQLFQLYAGMAEELQGKKEGRK